MTQSVPCAILVLMVAIREDSPAWLVAMVRIVNNGGTVTVTLDNDCQHAYDESDLDWREDEDAEPPRLDMPGSPHDMVVDMFAALGIKAEAV